MFVFNCILMNHNILIYSVFSDYDTQNAGNKKQIPKDWRIVNDQVLLSFP